jgi:hypothetical protein
MEQENFKDMVVTIIICIAYAWIFYEAKNAPEIDDDGNIINKNK